MSCTDMVDIFDEVSQDAIVKPIKLERKNVMSIIEENRDSNALSNDHSGTSVVDQEPRPMDENTSPLSTSSFCPAPLCRQFWKAGNYDDELGSRATLQSGKNYLHVHPKFLHSNATSHKWVFGAIAELLDNAIDEIQNGATFVLVDKLNNPRDGSQALLIQDDGGGMDPEAMRCCMSFGFSDRKSNSAIGQYGNGFKTSSMRLGADVIVFSRHTNDRTLTQSIGLLSYTFLTKTGHDRIVVPMVSYAFNKTSSKLEPWHQYGREHFQTNLSLLLQWSPYSTEDELLKQCKDLGYHGTKVIVYNLWFSDDGSVELDFDSDPKDICVAGAMKKIGTRGRTEQHISNRFHYSLRVYLSILYLRVPQSFRIVLRGQDIELHNIADDLKYPQFILYKPQTGGSVEGQVVTTIGFLKEAPHVNVHGFNVYHKNRLIMPFLQVLRSTGSRGRGVVGVLEANFIEPTHNKQEFERTSLFQKLEVRLKEMALEYWDYHCGLIGYHVTRKSRAPEPPHGSHHPKIRTDLEKPVILNQKSPTIDCTRAELSAQRLAATSSHCMEGRARESTTAFRSSSQEGVQLKRTQADHSLEPQKVKRQAGTGFGGIDARHSWEIQPLDTIATQVNDQETLKVMQENKKLHAQCLEYEKDEEELNAKVTWLRTELEKARLEHARLVAELQSFDAMKAEDRVND